MIEKKLKTTAICTGIFVILSLSVMFFRTATKNILIAEATNEQANSVIDKNSYELKIENASSKTLAGKIAIPLESGVGSDNITSQDVFVDHKFVLYINGKESDFYVKSILQSGTEAVKGATCTPINDKGRVCISLELDDLYETTTELEDRAVYVSFSKPDNEDENIVVIDPLDEYGLRLVPFIKQELADDNIKVFFTRVTDEKISESQIKKFLEETGADFYIQTGAENADENTGGVKTYFNDVFFIRHFGNVQLADELERNVVNATGQDALGLFPIEDDNELLRDSTIPSAYLILGNPANEVDNKMMTEDTYIESYAQGIADAITESFGIVNPVEQEETDALQGIIDGN